MARLAVIGNVLNTLINAVVSISLAWCAFRSVAVLAGETTKVDVLVKGLSWLGQQNYPPWLLAIAFLLLYLRERREKRLNIERLSPPKALIEQQIDPSRSTSGLTTRGTTAPKDIQ
jgi:hypothetical protein